jgi:hypothetical protein
MNEIEMITRKHFMIFPPYDFSKSMDRHWNSLIFDRTAGRFGQPARKRRRIHLLHPSRPLPNHPEFIFPKNDRAFHTG